MIPEDVLFIPAAQFKLGSIPDCYTLSYNAIQLLFNKNWQIFTNFHS